MLVLGSLIAMACVASLHMSSHGAFADDAATAESAYINELDGPSRIARGAMASLYELQVYVCHETPTGDRPLYMHATTGGEYCSTPITAGAQWTGRTAIKGTREHTGGEAEKSA
ncbi:uncharacterized protein Triagg1_2039 [Trichoderma aggressivum f. europaeum]|uniref:Uncharacterized protein n=1 Tax=Trichoderma aggressivum f. europaeum TaxID=173218 RepID=A0AAE1JFE8_9HYPO|nr:hypothetical protein Triagg1_2039 [Trichoderma aggressivum f. europaeum]